MAQAKINGYYFTMHPKAVAPAIYSRGETLADVYDSYSSKKERAYRYCKKMCYDLGGWNFSITGANCMTFSVMFDFAHPDTGELMRAHITKCYNHLYYL